MVARLHYFTAGITACLVCTSGCMSGTDDGAIGTSENALWYHPGEVYEFHTIPVCFSGSGTAEEQQWVQEAVVGIYSELTPLVFQSTGPTEAWVGCGPSFEGIKVDLGPGKSGTTGSTVLRTVHIQNSWPDPQNNCNIQTPVTWYDGHTWSSGHELCIKFAVLHEFLHALGAGHELGRTDVTPVGCPSCFIGSPPQTCSPGQPACPAEYYCADENRQPASTGTCTWNQCAGSAGYGPFDAYSITSYCTSSSGRLSTTDVAWLQETYGRTSNDWVWYVDGNPQDVWGPGQGLNIPGTVDTDSPGFQTNRLRVSISGTYTPLRGDFDDDGKGDIFWSRAGHIWWGRDRHGFDNQPDAYPVASGFVPVTGNFDGSGGTDIFWYMPGAGNDSVWWATGNRQAAFNGVLMQVGGGPYQPVAGDFDGNGADDIFWYAPGGASYVWWGRTNGSRNFDKPATQYLVNAGLSPTTGDFDGDQRADIWWLNPNGVDYMWWGNANKTFTATQVSAPLFTATTKAYAGNFAGVGPAADVYFDVVGPNDEVWVGTSTRNVWQKIPASIAAGYTGIVGNFDGLTYDDILWYTPGN